MTYKVRAGLIWVWDDGGKLGRAWVGVWVVHGLVHGCMGSWVVVMW